MKQISKWSRQAKTVFFCTIAMTLLQFEAFGVDNEYVKKFKDAASVALNLMYVIGFIWAVGLIWKGARLREDDPSAAKSALINASMIAGGTILAAAIFEIFGMKDAILTVGSP